MATKREIWNKVESVGVGCSLALICIFFLGPVFLLINVSLRPDNLMFKLPPPVFFWPTFEHFRIMLFERQFAEYVLNSVIVCVFSVGISLILGSLAGYAFSRLKFRGKNTLFLSYLTIRMMPPIVLAIPLFVLFRFAGLQDSRIGLILAYSSFNIPLVAWMMRGFFEGVPVEVEEAGFLDGCSRLGVLVRIVLPLTAPGFAASAVFSLLLSWNEFLFALVLTSTKKAQTIPVGVAATIGDTVIEWGNMSAACLITVVPIIVFTLILQKHIAKGLTAGAIK
jgi:multiple sugar transport system permease protein